MESTWLRMHRSSTSQHQITCWIILLMPLMLIRKATSGLPYSPDIYSIYEDRKGNFWMGTYMGLTRLANGRFDLVRDTIWDLEKEANNFAFDMIEDSGNNLWIAHSYGLCRYSNGRFYNYTVSDGLPGNQTRALTIDKNGNIWIATSDGVVIFDGNEFEIIDVKRGLSNNNCNDICTGTDNQIWVATENGLNRRTWEKGLKNITLFSTSNGLASNSILFVQVDHANQLWIGHGNGLTIMT